MTGTELEPVAEDAIEAPAWTEQRAQEWLTDIRTRIDDIGVRVLAAYHGRAWVSLGYDSWDALCVTELGTTLNLPRDARDRVVTELRAGGMSTRAIASGLGIGVGTAHRALPRVPVGTPDTKVTGTDGKQYATRAPALPVEPLARPTALPAKPFEAQQSEPAIDSPRHVFKEWNERGEVITLAAATRIAKFRERKQTAIELIASLGLEVEQTLAALNDETASKLMHSEWFAGIEFVTNQFLKDLGSCR